MATSDQRKKGKREELAVELSIVWIEEAVSPEICSLPKENEHTRACLRLQNIGRPRFYIAFKSASQSGESTNIVV